jgi:hypothetical protein
MPFELIALDEIELEAMSQPVKVMSVEPPVEIAFAALGCSARMHAGRPLSILAIDEAEKLIVSSDEKNLVNRRSIVSFNVT